MVERLEPELEWERGEGFPAGSLDRHVLPPKEQSENAGKDRASGEQEPADPPSRGNVDHCPMIPWLSRPTHDLNVLAEGVALQARPLMHPQVEWWKRARGQSMPKKQAKKKAKKNSRISLHPLTTEEALRAVMSGRPGELGRKLKEARKGQN